MKESKEKLYIKGKIKHHLDTVKKFYDKVQDDQSRIQTLRTEILAIKKAEGENGFDNARAKLEEFHEIHFRTFLLDQSLKINQSMLYEFNSAAKILGIEIEVEEDAKEFFNQVVSESPHMFIVDKGKVVMADTQTTAVIKKALDSKIKQDKTLKETYSNIV